jgi:hypothetical protein
MIVVNGQNHWQLTDSGTGIPQTKTEEQRIADNWPPPDGTPVLKADKSTFSMPRFR